MIIDHNGDVQQMTLTLQFLIVSLLPLSFIGMIFYTWRTKMRRQRLFIRWSFTLLMAALWSSSVLRFFGGEAIPEAVVFNWGFLSSYGLSLTAVTLLLTTTAYLNVAKGSSRVTFVVSILLLFTAVALDPEIWNYYLPFFNLGDIRITQFDIWGAVWVTSWLIPVMASWILAQQLKSNLSQSILRNQINYWLLVISLFFIGFALASIRQLGQSNWQQLGVIIVIIAAAVGTLTLTQVHLPELQLAARQLFSRLAGALIVFGLTLVALYFIVQAITNLPPETAAQMQKFILIVPATLFTVLFTFIFR